MNQADWKMLGFIALGSGFVINIFGFMIGEAYESYALYAWLMLTLGTVAMVSGIMFSWRSRQKPS